MSTLDGISVLLVEDEYLIALDAEQILKDLGAAKVEIVPSLDRAEKRAAEGSFDLAVLDVNLNGKLSYPVANVLKRRGIPVVFASGYELRNRPVPGAQDGISVSKPYTTERLREALAAALTAHGDPPGDSSQ